MLKAKIDKFIDQNKLCRKPQQCHFNWTTLASGYRVYQQSSKLAFLNASAQFHKLKSTNLLREQ